MSAKVAGFTHDDVDNKSVDWYTPAWIFVRMVWFLTLTRANLKNAFRGYRRVRPTV